MEISAVSSDWHSVKRTSTLTGAFEVFSSKAWLQRKVPETGVFVPEISPTAKQAIWMIKFVIGACEQMEPHTPTSIPAFDVRSVKDRRGMSCMLGFMIIRN